jgi:hypothetical protein
MLGDVVFFKRTNTLISKLISNITKSEFTHVGLIVEYDEMTGVATIIESNRFIETRETKIQLDDNHAVYSTGYKSDEVRDKIIKYAYGRIGSKYDYFQIFGLFISLLIKGNKYATFNSTNKLICSELIDLSYYKAGVTRRNSLNIGNVTPQELIDVYDLKDVRKGV